MVAAGHVDVVVEAGLKPYDIVALIPIVEGAGGSVTGWDGGTAAKGGRVVATGDRRFTSAEGQRTVEAGSIRGARARDEGVEGREELAAKRRAPSGFRAARRG